MRIYKTIDEIIGNTPLMELTHIENNDSEIKAKLLAKLEYLNPAGSIKDRVAKQMIIDVQESGLLKKDSVIIEPTSGNTGIGLAMMGVAKGYKTIIVMPDTMSIERIQTMKAYGADVVLSEGSKGMAGAIEKAEELAAQYPNSFIPGQFDNPSNPKAHMLTTGLEIWNDTDGKVDILVAGIGTGGTISGIGGYLKSKNPDIKVIGIEPKSSPVITKGVSGPHKIQGIGANFIPSILDKDIYDEIITVSDEDAINTGKKISRSEGILVGISSGAALYAAIEVAKRKENEGKNIVVILPDTGDRYLSTDLFK